PELSNPTKCPETPGAVLLKLKTVSDVAAALLRFVTLKVVVLFSRRTLNSSAVQPFARNCTIGWMLVSRLRVLTAPWDSFSIPGRSGVAAVTLVGRDVFTIAP